MWWYESCQDSNSQMFHPTRATQYNRVGIPFFFLAFLHPRGPLQHPALVSMSSRTQLEQRRHLSGRRCSPWHQVSPWESRNWYRTPIQGDSGFFAVARHALIEGSSLSTGEKLPGRLRQKEVFRCPGARTLLEPGNSL